MKYFLQQKFPDLQCTHACTTCTCMSSFIWAGSTVLNSGTVCCIVFHHCFVNVIAGASASLEGECSAAESSQGQGREREGDSKAEGAGTAATGGEREGRGREVEDFIKC